MRDIYLYEDCDVLKNLLNIYKEEPVLGGLSVAYSDMFDIARDAEYALKEM